jgi:hypothetical protein
LWERHLAAISFPEGLIIRGKADFAKVAFGYDG